MSNQARNHAMYADARREAIARSLKEVEEAETDIPKAKDRADKVIRDARERLQMAYSRLSKAETPLVDWIPEEHSGAST